MKKGCMKIKLRKYFILVCVMYIVSAVFAGCTAAPTATPVMTTTTAEATKVSETTLVTTAGDNLSGLDIVWLGSSVTFGQRAGGYSMADAIQDNHSGTTSHKFAKSGTTLVNDKDTSYIARMYEIDPNLHVDLFIVQLSTNDATQGKAMGTISTGKDLNDFDDQTIIGAVETIIAFASKTWNCPVVFYTGTYFESDEYSKMVEVLLQIEEKWDIDVIDLWNNEEMTELFGTDQYNQYMYDSIHPNRDGYVKWWTPYFEERLREIIAARKP